MDRSRPIAAWLITMVAMVAAMVVLGGLTRLTHSGLSMVEWKPLTGWLPPLGEGEWEEAFAGYRQFPEYKAFNEGMTVGEFKVIFWLEFTHRLWGRLIGIAFFVPFVVFMVKGWVRGALAVKLLVMFVLGGLQGVLGWYMVKSGLVDQPDVSQYRLVAHLGLALFIMGVMLWVAMGLLDPRPGKGGGAYPAAAAGVAALVFMTALSGGFVAGLDAGFSYNTFPLMEGELVPDGLFVLDPVLVNFFENVATVQFTHRWLAMSVLAAVAAFWICARRVRQERRRRLAANIMAAVAAIQVGLGVSTLVLVVPVPLAAAHQAGAMVLFCVSLWAVHESMRGGEAPCSDANSSWSNGSNQPDSALR